ncbi:hypothetical protein, partial [Arsukibacterium sp.]|uniref:hypothetical protein n=1 Tax=Arsukibacterium sp. TaxID=1977258 RepID=UPI002FDB3B45
MSRVIYFVVAMMVLSGCEVMNDIAWSDNTYLLNAKSENGYYIETYQTDTYGNFDGVRAGVRYDFYVTNNR